MYIGPDLLEEGGVLGRVETQDAHVELLLELLEHVVLLGLVFLLRVFGANDHEVDHGVELDHVGLEDVEERLRPLLWELLLGVDAVTQAKRDGLLLDEEADLVAVLCEVLPLEGAVHEPVTGLLHELVLVQLADELHEVEDPPPAQLDHRILKLNLAAWHLRVQPIG